MRATVFVLASLFFRTRISRVSKGVICAVWLLCSAPVSAAPINFAQEDKETFVCGRDFILRVDYGTIPDGGLQLVSPADRQQGPAATSITLTAGATLQANTAALAAFNRAIALWESYLNDPVFIAISADLDFTLPISTIGRATSRSFIYSYTILRAAMVSDAAVDEPILSLLPTLSQFSPVLPTSPTGIVFQDRAAATKANLRALGFDMSFDNANADATIAFNANRLSDFDFNPSDGIDPGKIDFEAVVIHEMGHMLGFISEVDDVESKISN